MKFLFVKLFTLVLFSLLVSACGKGRPQVVTGIQVQSSTINQDVILALKADLNLGTMSFPSVTLPIFHPRSQMNIGSVDLLPVLGGKNQIKISVNVSALSDIQATSASLPNGNLVPLIAQNPTMSIPLGAGAKLYLTIAANAVALGVAVPIKQFDSLGGAVGAVNLFPVFAIDKVIGAAGVFTSTQAGQNGFALVADVTQYVNMQDIFVPSQVASSNVKLDYSVQAPVAAKEEKINAIILDLNRRNTKLKLK
jgi:hypothetical protein